MLPDLGTKNAHPIINGITSAAGYTFGSRHLPIAAASAGAKAFTVYQAIVSPTELHAATKLALSPTKTMPLTCQFLKGVLTATRRAVKSRSGFKVAAMTSLRVRSTILKTAGGVTTIAGILMDVITLYSTGKELHEGTKCKVSQKISKHVEMLGDLSHQLDDLHRLLNRPAEIMRE